VGGRERNATEPNRHHSAPPHPEDGTYNISRMPASTPPVNLSSGMDIEMLHPRCVKGCTPAGGGRPPAPSSIAMVRDSFASSTEATTLPLGLKRPLKDTAANLATQL